MTGSTFSRVGRIGLVVFALVAFATFTMAWFSGANGQVIVGVDLNYVKPELPGVPHPLLEYFLEVAPLPAYLGLLLAGTVAVRRRWARFVAVAVVVLAAVLTVAVAAGLLASIEDYWKSYEVQRYRLYALVTVALAVLLLAAAGALAAGLRHAYHGFVIVLLFASAAFQLTCTVLLAGEGVGSAMTVVPWLAAWAYLLAAACALLALTDSRTFGSAPPDHTGNPAVGG
ncbi:hypothetical protein GCM10011608_02750 [Micromonospora sonchi]|uniref:DUF998 domain-containing protein n=1 Tax=Micromonospora sonchi TaxID=1763543 RepID=A0A917TG14_9ACTN|nr:hypothetical protein [Micromonospora sonchi]GGM21553.1 hypothetical protein GCM10011608_02750 [Micromonospora sonchi]